jgi:excisionase family DNA binding protein
MSMSPVMAVVRETKPRNLFTIAEAAETLGCSTKSIMRWHTQGKVNLVRWGQRGWRMHRSEIERLERDGMEPAEA